MTFGRWFSWSHWGMFEHWFVMGTDVDDDQVEELPHCPTSICRLAKVDGIICSDDQCDLELGYRPRATP